VWILIDLNEASSLRRAIEALEALDPHNVLATIGRGFLLSLGGHPDESVAAFEAVVARYPYWHQGHCYLATVLQNAERWPQAAAAARRAIELSPTCSKSHGVLSAALRVGGQFEEALGEAEKAIELSPTRSAGWVDKGRVLRTMGRLEDSLRALDEAVRLSKSALNLRSRSVTLYELKRWEEALRDVDEAIALEPTNEALLRNRVAILRALERWNELLAQVRALIRPDSPFDELHLSALVALLALHREDEALQLLETSARGNEAARCIALRARLLATLGREKEAFAAAEEALTRGGRGPEVRALLRVEFLRRFHRPAEAREEARAFLRRTPVLEDEDNRAYWLALAGDEEGATARLPSLPTPKSVDEFYGFASLLALLGRADECFVWLTKAVEAGFVEPFPDPDFDRVRSDPRFAPLEHRILQR
jgi:tetratricopeptide (TPR) repeat protein